LNRHLFIFDVDFHVPLVSFTCTLEDVTAFYREVLRKVGELPGVERVAIGTVAPWRDKGFFEARFSVEGYEKADGEEDSRARFRTVSPGFFQALKVPIIAGRDFDESDRRDSDSVVIVSQSLARRMFPNQEAVNHRLMWTDPVMKFIDVSTSSRRIVGVVPNVDDENVVPGTAMTVYHPLEQEVGGGRLFVHASSNPDGLVQPITQTIRQLSAEQPVEHAATLDDVRAEVLAPNRLNAMVFGGFAVMALTIAVVGVAGVLAFSVNLRTREFGVRLAIGSEPRQLLERVLAEGALIGFGGIVAGMIGALVLVFSVAAYVPDVRVPDALPLLAAAGVLVAAAIFAALMPTLRASRVDLVQALRSE
jgi:ABC-type antimicrobial peptide transport system permease subunit